MKVPRNLNVHSVEGDIMDSVGQGVTHHSMKTHRKEVWKGDRKGNGKGTQKVESSKVEKAERTR